MKEQEIWKPIPGFEGYEVSDLGGVRSFFKRGGIGYWQIMPEVQRVLAEGTKPNGYKFVLLHRDGKPYNRYVHSLVALAFIGTRPRGLCVCHNNSDITNNSANNLRYDTQKENMQDAVKAGSFKSQSYLDGWKSRRIITDEIILDIQRLYSEGVSPQEIARQKGVSSVYRFLPSRYVKVSNNDITQIRIFYANGYSLGRLNEIYHLDPAAISRIVRGLTRKEAGGPIKGIDYVR